jgi:hypothetical protein
MVLIGADVHIYNDLKRLRGARLPALTVLVAPNPDAIAASYILTVRGLERLLPPHEKWRHSLIA